MTIFDKSGKNLFPGQLVAEIVPILAEILSFQARKTGKLLFFQLFWSDIYSALFPYVFLTIEFVEFC